MKRGQISLDFLFAVTLIGITALNIVYVASSERVHSETFDTVSKLKAFSIDVRDSVVKVYSSGNGFTLRKDLPMELGAGDNVTLVLAPPDKLLINATIGGRRYSVIQKVPLSLHRKSSVVLTSENRAFLIRAQYNETGGWIDVTLST